MTAKETEIFGELEDVNLEFLTMYIMLHVFLLFEVSFLVRVVSLSHF
jgi:hypothetical protein